METKIICSCLAIAILFAGCGGRNAYPIQTYIPGDDKLNCPGLARQISNTQEEMDRLRPQMNKFGYNTLCFVGGVLFLVPFFFMDLKNAEKVEYDAQRQRYNYLTTLASQKGC